MKILQLLIFLILFIYISSDACRAINPSNAADCKDEVLENKKKDNGVHCCYFTYKEAEDNTETKGCVEVSKVGYENIKDYIKNMEINNEDAYDVNVDCKAIYLQFSLIILFLLFL